MLDKRRGFHAIQCIPLHLPDVKLLRQQARLGSFNSGIVREKTFCEHRAIMYLLRRLFITLSVILFGSIPLAAQESEPSSAAAPANESMQLSPEYLRLLRDAGVEFQKRNLDSALKILDQADAITLDTPVALNLRGAVYTEKKDFAKADELFKKALDAAPGYFAAEFNRGEILFLQQKYPEAREHFEKMLKTYEGNELLQYKISLTYLQEDNIEKATEWKDKIKFPSDSPAYYFAHAALSFKKGDEADAVQWIASSERIFGSENIILFLESLVDLGYVQRPNNEARTGADTSLPSGGAGGN